VQYEWDPAKNAANLAKHGIDFADAMVIFDGPVLETVDKRRNYGEERIAAIGVANDLELFVVYTMRGRNRRLISARRASRYERERYRQAISRSRREGQN
jgi:uncharacterized protein